MFVLEMKCKPNQFFPTHSDPNSMDYVCELNQAQLFVGEVVNGKLETRPKLPQRGEWVMRTVEVRLK